MQSGGIATDSMHGHNISLSVTAKTCANRMLGSADPEHIDCSDRSAA